MALTSWSASNYLRRLSQVINTYPFILDGSFNANSITWWPIMTVGQQGDTTEAALRGEIDLEGGTNHFEARSHVPGQTAGGTSLAVLSTATWYYGTGHFVSTTDRRAHVNNGTAGTDATTCNPAASDMLLVGQ